MKHLISSILLISYVLTGHGQDTVDDMLDDGGYSNNKNIVSIDLLGPINRVNGTGIDLSVYYQRILNEKNHIGLSMGMVKLPHEDIVRYLGKEIEVQYGNNFRPIMRLTYTRFKPFYIMDKTLSLLYGLEVRQLSYEYWSNELFPFDKISRSGIYGTIGWQFINRTKFELNWIVGFGYELVNYRYANEFPLPDNYIEKDKTFLAQGSLRLGYKF